MEPYLHIIVSTTCVYLFILVALRVFGKTELAQLSITDLIFVLLISNAVQNAMVGPDTSLSGGLLAALVLFLLNFLFKKLKYRYKGFQNLLEGEAVLLIYNGVIQEKNCKKHDITLENLMEALRQHGESDLAMVASMVLEANGAISVVLTEKHKHSKK
jgi:uncharacterized membrane protein YcaP (DUF421 family)